MKISNFLFIFILMLSLLFQDNDWKKNPPPIKFEFDISSVVPDSRKINSQPLLISKINEIRNKAKLFIPEPVSENDTIIITTNKGKIKFKFYEKLAPNHCLNFKKLANSGYYDSTLFHIIISEFMILGGDILTRDSDTENDGLGGPGWMIDDEFNEIEHKRGTLSMARSKNLNSAGSQFFICLGTHKHLDGEYTAFGYNIEGDHVLDVISNVRTQYEQAQLMSKSKIPDNENINEWVEVFNIQTKTNLYTKVPQDINKKAYQKAINERFKNLYKPEVPVLIKSIRVMNSKN